MISAAESLAHVLLAAGISTAMAGRAFVDRPARGRVRRPWFACGALAAAMTCGVALADTDVGRSAEPGRVVATLAALVVAALVAASLAAVGLRGRRVGDHPYCRRCGFDLTGRPDASRACAECGAALDDAARAIVVGERRRRVAPLLAGVFVGVIALAYATSLTPGIVRWARAADFSAYKPMAWLIDDLSKADRLVRARATGEINSRAARGKLDAAAVDRAVIALLNQSLANPNPRMPGIDPDRAFATYIAENAWRTGTAGESTLRRTMRANLKCTLVVAPQASAGRTLRYWIAKADADVGREDDAAVPRLTIANRVDALDGTPLPAPTWSTLRLEGEWPGLECFGNAFDLRGHATPGPARLSTRFTLTSTLALPGRPTIAESADVTLTGTTTLVMPAAMACPIATPTTRPDAPTLRIVRGDRAGPRLLAVRAPSQGALLADVVLRHAGATRTLGTIFAEANYEASVPLESKPPGAYVIELRPVPERGVDLFRPVPILGAPTTIPSAEIEDDR